jgi:hypothetical protein
MMGPGKHDHLCTYVREQLRLGEDAGGVMLIVLHPDPDMSGFACQADYETTMALPDILESVARQIREDRDKGIP